MSSTAKNDLTFLVHPNADRTEILASYQSCLEEFASLLARQPENLISGVARTFELARTPHHFQNYGKVNLPKAGYLRQRIQNLLDQTLGKAVNPTEYGFIRGRMIEILVEVMVRQMMGYSEIHCDTFVLVRNAVVAYPAEQPEPSRRWVRSIDVCGLSHSRDRGIFLECKAHPDLFYDENFHYLQLLERKLATIRQFDFRVLGVTLMLKSQLRSYYLKQPEQQRLIHSIHDLCKMS